MSEIKSGRFSIKVDRVINNTQMGTDGKTSEVIVYKGLNLLTPVNVTPSENQYRVTLSCTGCTAELKDDYKTIYVKNVTASSAKIEVTINVENKVNYKKIISIEKVISENEISNMKSNISAIEQKADSISLRVEQTEENLLNNYPTYSNMNSAINMKADSITSTISKTYTTKDDFNNLNIGSRNMLLKTSDYKTLSCNGTENQSFFLYNISDPSLLAGKKATLTFTYEVNNWNGQGGFTPQTGDSNYVWFNQFWLWSEGKFEYSATTSFPSNFNDTKFYIRSDWIHGTIKVTEARLVISDKKADWSPAPEDVENRMSTLEQTAETLTAKFNDGFNMGIIEQSIDGIKVKHSSIDNNSYTHMSATGFYVKNKGTDAFRVDANGLYVKGNGDFTGKVTANDGSIGGFTISSGKLVGNGGNGVGMSGNGDDWAFWAGSNTGGNAPFHVGHEGNLYATQAYITGTITSSTINGGTINGGVINGSTVNSDSFVGDVLAIDGTISAKSLQVQDIDSAKYPATLDGNVDLYVNSSSGNDDIEVDDDARFKTLQGAIDAIPKFLNNKTVYITMETDSTEDVSMRGIVGGAIRIYMNGKTLYGTLRSYVCAASINIYGGTRSSNEGATGVIHPSVGISFGGRAASVGFEASQYAAIYKVKVFAPDSLPSDVTNTDKVCIASQSGTGSVYCKNIQIVNAAIGFRANNVGAMHVNSSSGVASKYGFQATTGGIITIANNAQAGGQKSSTNKSAGGQVLYDTNGPTFATGNQSTDGGTAPVVSTTKTITIKSSYGDTYRSSVYNNWKKDGTVRQGDYGYGDCNGCWFFGSAFAEVKGATIKKVTITITRQSGGSSSAVELVVKSHGYSSRPNGKPSYRTTAGTLSLAAGKSGPLVITNSTILSEISSGAVKGFGIQSTYNSSNYAVCSGSVTVKIEYQE